MIDINKVLLIGCVGALFAAPFPMVKAEMPSTLAAPDERAVVTFHAEGAQVYECKADAAGKLAWQFREPIATLLKDGKTVGRHFAGPTWELADGSAVTARVTGRSPGTTSRDIPLLKLAVTSHRNGGEFAPVTVIQRLNTEGGALEGPCGKAGALASVPYSADYTFLHGPS